MKRNHITQLSRCLILSCVFILFSNQNAWGYYYLVRTGGCNDGGVIRSTADWMKLGNISFPPGSTWERAVIYAMREFNTDIPGSSWSYMWSTDYDGTVGSDDGISEVAFQTSANIGSTAPGHIKRWYEYDIHTETQCSLLGCIITGCSFKKAINEADVLFNSDYFWSSSLEADPNASCVLNDSNSPCNLKATALHEFGHAAGLQHENRWLATMGKGNYSYYGSQRNLPMLHADDKAGMRFLYGNGVTNNDISVNAWKQTSTSGEYGDIGLIGQDTFVTGTNTYAFMEYTVENHGTEILQPKIGFYVYDNGWRLVTTTLLSGIQPGSAWLVGRYVLIPNGLKRGYHTFKIVADYDNQLAETNELNNEFELPQGIYINRYPILDPIGNKVFAEGQQLSFGISATDVDGDTLTYSVSSLPSSATFSGNTFTWKANDNQAGNYGVTFTVSDGQFTDSETITITVMDVNPAQMISPAPNSTLTSSTVTFQWNTGIGITQYWLQIGTTLGATNIYNQSQGTATSVTVSGIPQNGQPVYVRLLSYAYAEWKYNDYTYQTPVDLFLSNQTINSGVVGYQAGNSITAGPAFIIQGTADVTFKAGTVITLKPGFQTMTGSKFRAVPNLN